MQKLLSCEGKFIEIMRLRQYINESIMDKGILKACFILGVAGAGKSYVLQKIKSGQIEPRIVNTDKLFHMYGSKEWEKWIDIKDTVKKLSRNQLASYINSLLPLAIDGTGSYPGVIFRRYGLLESFGYDIAGIFIDTSLETALERASKRERQVSKEFIRDTYDKIYKAKSFYKSKFHTWKEIKNDEGELTDKVITKAFNLMNNFYNSKLINPVGIHMLEEMRKNGWKYMTDGVKDIDEIKMLLNAWYKKV